MGRNRNITKLAPTVVPTDDLYDNLLCWWVFDKANPYIIDISSNAKNATVSGPISQFDGIIGKASYFQGTTEITADSAASLINTSEGTISIWANMDNWNDSAWNYFFDAANGSSDRIRIAKSSSNTLYINYKKGAVNIATFTPSCSHFKGWNLLTMTWSVTNGSIYFYVNDELNGSYLTFVVGEAASAITLISIASNNGGGEGLTGLLSEVMLFSEAKTLTQVSQLYNRSKKLLLDLRQDDLTVDTIDQGAALETPVGINWKTNDATGLWRISSNTINGVSVKVLESKGPALSNYSLYYSNKFSYGTWEFYLWKKDTGSYNMNIGFIYTTKGVFDSTGTGYGFYLAKSGANGLFVFNRMLNGAASSEKLRTASSFALETWLKVKITRNYAGIFTVYVNDVAVTPSTGANPFTDTTYKDSSYLSLNMGDGDKIAFLNDAPGVRYKIE